MQVAKRKSEMMTTQLSWNVEESDLPDTVDYCTVPEINKKKGSDI